VYGVGREEEEGGEEKGAIIRLVFVVVGGEPVR